MGVNVDDTIDNGLADLKVGSWQELGKVFPSESFDKMYFSLSTGNTIQMGKLEYYPPSTGKHGLKLFECSRLVCLFNLYRFQWTFYTFFPTLPSKRGLGDGWSGDVGERVLIPCPHVTVQSPNPTLLPGTSTWWRVLCGVEKNRRGAGEGRMELIWRRIMFDWLATSSQVTVWKR